MFREKRTRVVYWQKPLNHAHVARVTFWRSIVWLLSPLSHFKWQKPLEYAREKCVRAIMNID